jgi:Cu+-exporting ATPase
MAQIQCSKFEIHDGGEMMKNTTTIAKDPVCSMDVDTATAAGRSEHAGQTYYFCGSKCKDKFDKDPHKYLDESAETKSSRGCCG